MYGNIEVLVFSFMIRLSGTIPKGGLGNLERH